MALHMKGTSTNIRKFSFFEISIISLFWLLLFASPLLFGRTKEGIDWSHVLKMWKEHFVLFALFILNRFFLVPYLFFRHKRAIYIITIALLTGIATTGFYFYDKKPQADYNRKPPANNVAGNRRNNNPKPASPSGQPRQRRGPGNQEQPEPIPAYINLLILSVLVFGFDTGLKTASKWVYSEQQRIILEKENIQTQLAFLKHQISPHFFMNTLNNIHSLIDVNAVEAKKSIIKLSGLMRHLLYESEQELSPIKNEVEFVKSYVDLMRLRYSQDVRITLNIPEKIPDKSIPPLLFISLLENAFKHGISYVQESFVDIELSFRQDKMQLRITNSKGRTNIKSAEAGIGIENTRKRLDLLFNDKYTLDVTDTGNTFITNLAIPV